MLTKKSCLKYQLSDIFSYTFKYEANAPTETLKTSIRIVTIFEMFTHNALQFDDFFEDLVTTKFGGQCKWSESSIILDFYTGPFRMMFHGITEHVLKARHNSYHKKENMYYRKI